MSSIALKPPSLNTSNQNVNIESIQHDSKVPKLWICRFWLMIGQKKIITEYLYLVHSFKMREDLVKSAVSFLSSEKVKSADNEKKTQFLKQKGLTDEEINEAFKRIDTDTPLPSNTAPKLPPRTPSLYQPIQVVYYPPPPIPRMTSRQILRYAVAIGLSAFGITIAVAAVIKTIMLKILNSISSYQRNRYNERREALSRIEATLRGFSKTIENKSIIDEQTKLHTSLDRLIATIKSSSRDDKLYTQCSSALTRFKNTLINNALISPSSAYDTRAFGSYSGFADAHAQRYQVNTDQTNIIQSIKSDIRSFKGSLLSRRNFPTAARQIMPVPQTPTFVPPPPSSVDPNASHPRNRYQRVMKNN